MAGRLKEFRPLRLSRALNPAQLLKALGGGPNGWLPESAADDRLSLGEVTVNVSGSSMLLAAVLQIAAGWPWVGNDNPHGSHFRSDAPTILKARWRGRSVVMRLTPAVVLDCHAADWLHGAVADRQDRCVRIGSMDVTVAGAPIPISGSAYADLGGVNELVLQTRKDRMVLYILGPDGPEYYGATLRFGQSDMASRRLDLSDGSRQVTIYTDVRSPGR